MPLQSTPPSLHSEVKHPAPPIPEAFFPERLLPSIQATSFLPAPRPSPISLTPPELSSRNPSIYLETLFVEGESSSSPGARKRQGSQSMKERKRLVKATGENLGMMPTQPSTHSQVFQLGIATSPSS